MMTEEDLDKLEQLSTVATPGPWVADMAGIRAPNHDSVADAWSDNPHDAAFIAASREAIPALIAEVRRLRAEIEERDRREYDAAIEWRMR